MHCASLSSVSAAHLVATGSLMALSYQTAAGVSVCSYYVSYITSQKLEQP